MVAAPVRQQGLLCLEWGPDNWQPDVTGAQLLRSAYKLLLTENPKGEGAKGVVQSRDRVDPIQSYDWIGSRLLVSAGCRERILAGTAEEVRAVLWPTTMSLSRTALVHDRMDRLPVRRPPAQDVRCLRFERPAAVSRQPPPAEAADRPALLAASGLEPDVAPVAGAAFLLFAGGPNLTAYFLPENGAPEWWWLFVLPEEPDGRSGRAEQAMGKRVTIVGAGSVGSKLAESLARSGVTRFTLVDGDVMLPGNLERHALDWRDVGSRKVEGLRRRILEVLPGAEVEVVTAMLDWQRSAVTHDADVYALTQGDIIVDATGNAATTLLLGAMAAANRRAFVSVEVFAGGIGALVASYVPGRDKPYARARVSFDEWCRQQPIPPPVAGKRPYEGAPEDGPPIVADDAAVTMAAGHAARVVLDILDGTPAVQPQAWLLFGFRKGWVFSAHGHNIIVDVGAPGEAAPVEPDPETDAFVDQFVEKILRASSPTP